MTCIDMIKVSTAEQLKMVYSMYLNTLSILDKADESSNEIFMAICSRAKVLGLSVSDLVSGVN